MRGRGNLIIHSAIRSHPRFRWAPKHQLAYIYCTTEPESVKGARISPADLQALVNPARRMRRRRRVHFRGALVRAVRRLAEGLTHQPLPEADSVSLTRAKVEPMVRGLFPCAEQDAGLTRIEQSVV